MSKFRVDPETALQAALDYGLTDVVVIGRDEDDEVYISSSMTSDSTFDLIEEGSDAFEALAVNEERDARTDEDEA